MRTGGCSGRGQGGMWVVSRVTKSQESMEGRVSERSGWWAAVNT